MSLWDILISFIVYGFCLLIGGLITLNINEFFRSIITGGVRKKGFSFRKIFLPFYYFLDVFSPSALPRQVLSLPVFIILPLFYFLLVMAASSFLPTGFNVVFFPSEEGIFWLFLLIAFINLITLMMGYMGQSIQSMWGLPYFFIAFCNACFVLFMVVLCVVLWSGSMNLENIVNDQKALWFVVPLFPVFLIYLFFIMIFCHRNPFGIMNIEGKSAVHYKAEYAGGIRTFLTVSEHLMFLLLCGFGVTLFLGGTLPLTTALNWSPASWFLVKLIFFMFVVTWISSAVPNMRRDQALRFSTKVIFPFSAVTFILYVFVKTIFY